MKHDFTVAHTTSDYESKNLELLLIISSLLALAQVFCLVGIHFFNCACLTKISEFILEFFVFILNRTCGFVTCVRPKIFPTMATAASVGI